MHREEALGYYARGLRAALGSLATSIKGGFERAAAEGGDKEEFVRTALGEMLEEVEQVTREEQDLRDADAIMNGVHTERETAFVAHLGEVSRSCRDALAEADMRTVAGDDRLTAFLGGSKDLSSIRMTMRNAIYRMNSSLRHLTNMVTIRDAILKGGEEAEKMSKKLQEVEEELQQKADQAATEAELGKKMDKDKGEEEIDKIHNFRKLDLAERDKLHKATTAELAKIATDVETLANKPTASPEEIAAIVVKLEALDKAIQSMDHAEKLDEAMTQVRIRLEETVSQDDLQEALESVKSNVLGPLAEVPGQLVQMREEHERAAGKMEGLETEVQGKVGHDELEARLEGVAMLAAQAVATGGADQEQWQEPGQRQGQGPGQEHGQGPGQGQGQVPGQGQGQGQEREREQSPPRRQRTPKPQKVVVQVMEPPSDNLTTIGVKCLTCQSPLRMRRVNANEGGGGASSSSFAAMKHNLGGTFSRSQGVSSIQHRAAELRAAGNLPATEQQTMLDGSMRMSMVGGTPSHADSEDFTPSATFPSFKGRPAVKSPVHGGHGHAGHASTLGNNHNGPELVELDRLGEPARRRDAQRRVESSKGKYQVKGGAQPRGYGPTSTEALGPLKFKSRPRRGPGSPGSPGSPSSAFDARVVPGSP